MIIKDGRISLFFNDDGLRIELRDDDASTTFVRVQLTAKQTCQVMSRLANVPCKKLEVFSLDCVGKKMEHKDFEFKIADNKKDQYTMDLKEKAQKAVKKVCPKGWTPDLYFGSLNSFFNVGDEMWARTTIRRWVAVDKNSI